MGNDSLIVDFSKLYTMDLEMIGKKAYDLGQLAYIDVLIPEGFVLTTKFHEQYVLNLQNRDNFPDLVLLLHKAYRKLAGEIKQKPLNIFSSSASSYKSMEFHEVKGDANFLLKIKEIYENNMDSPVSIIVQKATKSKIRGRLLTSEALGEENNDMSKNQIEELIKICLRIQKHFYFPKEIAYEVIKNKIYITDIKPQTNVFEPESVTLPENNLRKILIKGSSLHPGITTGRVKILHKDSHHMKIRIGDIIVIPNITNNLYDYVKGARAVISDSSLDSDYAKMLYRKNSKIPTIEGTKDATKVLKNGEIITVNGEKGEVYKGGIL